MVKNGMKITFGMIVFNGEHFLKQCLESVYPFAYQILIAEGPVSYWQNQGYSTSFDRTNEILNSFPDPQNKIKIVHSRFLEKDDQCRAYMQFLDPSADYIWNLDSDEVYKQRDIETLIKLLHDYKYTSVGVQSCSFYGGFERHIGGFEEERDQFLRVFKVYPGSTWLTHRPPTIIAPPSTAILPKNHLSSDILWEQHGIRMYHYSYVMPNQVKQKIGYYKMAVSKHKCIDNYYESVYLPWVKGSPEQRLEIERQFNGVHEWKPEYRTHTLTKPFLEEHPESIQSSIEQLKMNFNNQLIGS
jgi:glycosyltransferase involved in cell wall biosynthesis